MAIRNIRVIGDGILTKRSREIEKVDQRILELIDDMIETMQEASGVGLAAPQIGILKRLVVIDVPGEDDESNLMVLINPEILSEDGKQTGEEGCLSVPGKIGIVTRPSTVRAKAYDRDMEEFIIEAEGLLARAICHEIDHLNGKLYVERVEGEVMDVDEYYADEEE